MSDEYIKRSPVTGRKYDYFSKDVLHLVNLEQCDWYMNECGIMPLDIMLSEDRKRPGKKIVLFCFDKNECRDAYLSWLKRGEEKKNQKENDNETDIF